MIIRLLTPADVVEHDKITSQAFSYACDLGADSALPCEKVLGAFDDDNKTLFADFELHERTCNYDGGVLTCAAIGGVAAKPEHRGKGAVKALFAHLFEKTDYDISILYPFSEAYYRKLGYERVGRSVCVTVPFSDLSGIRRNTDVRLYEGRDTEQLLALYNRCARKDNLSFVRENADAFPDRPYLSQTYMYVWKNNAFATIRINREKSTVFVKELCFDSCASMLGIVGFLRNFESNQKHVCFEKLPEDSPLLHFLPDLKNCVIQVQNTGSARLLKTESVLKAHRYPHDGEFSLQVGSDGFRVACTKGDVRVEKACVRDPDLTMDIPTASKILLSGLADAAYMPNLVVRNPNSAFFDLFPPRTCFFTDAL